VSDPESSKFVLMDDGVSCIQLTSEDYEFMEQQKIHLTGARIYEQEGGKVFKAMDVQMLDSNGNKLNSHVFKKPVKISIGYLVDERGNVYSGRHAMMFDRALPSASEAPNEFSIYWNNGGRWLKLGTEVDTLSKSANVKTRNTGSYQLRLVNQADIQQNSVFPKTITPNGVGSMILLSSSLKIRPMRVVRNYL